MDKTSVRKPPLPQKLPSFGTSPPPPNPLGISVALRGGVWIFSETTQWESDRKWLLEDECIISKTCACLQYLYQEEC